jgi:hypothetical protein
MEARVHQISPADSRRMRRRRRRRKIAYNLYA